MPRPCAVVVHVGFWRASNVKDHGHKAVASVHQRSPGLEANVTDHGTRPLVSTQVSRPTWSWGRAVNRTA